MTAPLDIVSSHVARVVEVGTYNGKPGVMLDVKGHGKMLACVSEDAARAWGAMLYKHATVEIRISASATAEVEP